MLTSPGPVWSKDPSTQHLGSRSQAFSELHFFADFLPKAFHVKSWLCHLSPQTAHDQVTVSVHKGRNLVFTSVLVQHHETTRKTLCQKGWVQILSGSLAIWACSPWLVKRLCSYGHTLLSPSQKNQQCNSKETDCLPTSRLYFLEIASFWKYILTVSWLY